MKICIPAFALGILFWYGLQPYQNKKFVQFNIDKLLNARPVTTLTGNKLVPWAKGIDGNGLGDGYLTKSAAKFNGDDDTHALPNDPLFPANNSHPEIKLHYSNTDSSHYQACAIIGEGQFEFPTPKAKYSDIYLALTSAEGASNIRVSFNYIDGVKVKDFVVPDYYADVKSGDPDLCYLAHDLAKWGNKNNMTEKDHHNIDLLNIHPDPARALKNIAVHKTKPAYLVFWAATGVRVN